MTPSPLDKQTAGCKSPHNQPMSWPWIYLLCVIFRAENGTNRHHLAVFNIDLAFVHYFMAPHQPHPPTLYRSACGIGYTSKKYLKAINSTIGA